MARLEIRVRYVYFHLSVCVCVYVCLCVHVCKMKFSPSFSSNPMETPPQVLFGLGIVVGPAGLLELIAEVVFLQLPGIADHKLLGKVLHGKRRANKL